MELAFCADDAMGDVVAIAEDDCRPGFHRELIWGKSEIIDIHLHVRRATGQRRNAAERERDKKRAETAPCAGVAPCAKSHHVMFLLFRRVQLPASGVSVIARG